MALQLATGCNSWCANNCLELTVRLHSARYLLKTIHELITFAIKDIAFICHKVTHKGVYFAFGEEVKWNSMEAYIGKNYSEQILEKSAPIFPKSFSLAQISMF